MSLSSRGDSFGSFATPVQLLSRFTRQQRICAGSVGAGGRGNGADGVGSDGVGTDGVIAEGEGADGVVVSGGVGRKGLVVYYYMYNDRCVVLCCASLGGEK